MDVYEAAIGLSVDTEIFSNLSRTFLAVTVSYVSPTIQISMVTFINSASYRANRAYKWK